MEPAGEGLPDVDEQPPGDRVAASQVVSPRMRLVDNGAIIEPETPPSGGGGMLVNRLEYQP